MTFVCFAFPLLLLLHCVVDIGVKQCFDNCKFSNKRVLMSESQIIAVGAQTKAVCKCRLIKKTLRRGGITCTVIVHMLNSVYASTIPQH